MVHCEFCGSDLPIYSHFCGNCGHLLGERTQAATGITPPPVRERNTDENQAVLPDILLPGALMAHGQTPPAGQVPMIQGTPQVGGVPSIRGTPSVPGSPPPSGHVLAHGAAPSAPPRAPTWQQQVSSPPHHPVYQPQPAPPPHHHPAQHPQPTPPPHEPPHEHHHHRHHSGPLHVHKPRSSRHHGTASGATTKLALGAASKWLVIVLTAVVVIATSGVVLVLANPPGLSLTGSSAVTAGGILHLRGKGFLPGGSVTLTLDNGLPVSVAGQRVPQGSAQETRNANFAGSTQMFIAGASEQQTAVGTNISVSATGTFDANIAVRASWSAGVHTVHATESLGSRSASLPFTILQAKLVVKPAMLDFGSLEVGGKAVLAVTVSNQGKARLSWTASIDSSGAPWLTLQNSTGVIEVNNPGEFIYVAADATRLKKGTYTATLNIHSNGGDAQVPVDLQVVSKSSNKQALLNITPQSLDFGKLLANQQALQPISIGNLGELPLNWQAAANATSSGWLALSVANGTVQPGTVPQTIQVLVNTTGLAAGSYTGTINITSNGGNAQVAVTLTVSAPLPGSPTPSPTPPPPPLIGSPNSFSVPGPNCKYSSSLGWTCTATLSSFAGAKTNLNWSASSRGVGGVTFNPQSGTLAPGQAMPVIISIPNTTCPAIASFTFAGPANQVLIPWSCGALTLTASKASINANTDCTFGNGWTCNVTLGTDSSDQGQLGWSASGSGINGIGFSPASGILTAGQTTSVTITVPSTTCPANASFSFAGQGTNTVTVAWSCVPPQLSVSPGSIYANNDCTFSAETVSWNCTVALSSNQNAQTGLNWSASSSGITDQGFYVSFTPANGTLSPGQSAQVNINIAANAHFSCVGSSFTGTLTFSGPANTVNVPWNCTSPILVVSPTSLNGNTDCTQSAGGPWTCNVTLSQQSQGEMEWSASSTGISGITFNPDYSRFVGPGNSMQVTITIPNTTCPATANLIFTGSGNTVTVPWSCTSPPPMLSVNPTSLASTDLSTCPYDNVSNSWTCAVTLTDVASDSQGNISWSASTSLSGITFNPPSGTMGSSQILPATINIPATSCTNGTFVYQATFNTVSVTWSCSSSSISGTSSGVSFSNSSLHVDRNQWRRELL